MLGQQVGMAPRAIARAIDLDAADVMQQALEQRGCDGGAAADLSPFGKAGVRGESHRSLYVAYVGKLEEQVTAAGYHRELHDATILILAEDGRVNAIEQDVARHAVDRLERRSVTC